MTVGRTFIVDVSGADRLDDFAAAFNKGFCAHLDGRWHGESWDAFNDYLSWPNEDQYRLIFRGWSRSRLDENDKWMIQRIIGDNPHVQVVYE